jgi:hypothetical protein
MGHTFTDTTGRVWPVRLDIATARRVRSETGVDLCGPNVAETMQDLAADPINLVDVLYLVCVPANGSGVTPEDFGGAMGGEAVEHALDALVGALSDFFPGRTGRAILRRAIEETPALRAAEAAAVERVLADFGAPSPGVAASSATTPASSP